MAGTLARAETMWIGVRTLGGRTLEYQTSLVPDGIGDTEQAFTVRVPLELRDRLETGQIVLVKVSLPESFLLFEARILALPRTPFASADLSATDPARVRRIPRRQHYRVSAELPVTFTFDRPDAHVPERTVTLTATTFDISAGGIGVLVDRARSGGVMLPAVYTGGRIELTLASGDPAAVREPAAVIACAARVARVEEIEHTTRVRLGIDFQTISEPQRMEVSRFVIAHQLALRRRGTF